MGRWIVAMASSAAIVWGTSPADAISVDARCLFHVEFASGMATLTNEALKRLNQFVMECPRIYDGIVVIEGHSDSVGTATAKLSISSDRAEAVRQYLISTGIPARSIRMEAHADSRPSAQPVGEAYVDEYVRSMNRRVLVFVERGSGR